MGCNEEAGDGSSLFYTLSEADERGSGVILGNQHLTPAQADSSGHRSWALEGVRHSKRSYQYSR